VHGSEPYVALSAKEIRNDLTSPLWLYLVLQLRLQGCPADEGFADSENYHQTQADEVEFLR